MTGSEEISRASVAGEAVLEQAVHAFVAALGDRLLAAYALGSLAHGGFSPLVSDVDLGLVLADPLLPADGGTIARVTGEIAGGGGELHSRLSVFWGSPATLGGGAEGGRFPPLDRLDLLEHGRLLSGQDVRAGLPPPSLADLLVSGAEFALATLGRDDVVDAIRRPETLLAGGVHRVTKLVLFPVRFLYTAETGLVGTNDAAAAVYTAGGAKPGAELVAAALRWRTAPPADLARALEPLRGDLIPLYGHFLRDHEARLAEAGRPDLAGAFAGWRARIEANR